MKTILFNPGPTNVAETVRRALIQNDINHREEEFSEMMLFINKTLVKVLDVADTHSAVMFASSGTGCNEAIINSIHGKILLLNNGKYSSRLGDITSRYGIPYINHKIAPYAEFDMLEIEKLLIRHPEITHILLVHHETTTGVLAPLKKIGALAREYQKVLAIDAISSLGGHELDLKECNVSFCSVSANKCIEAFPGISFVIAEKNEVVKLKGKSRSYYFDLYEQWCKEEAGETPFTLPVQIAFALKEALINLEKEGLSNRIRRYQEVLEKMKAGLEKIGFNVICLPKEMSSNILISIEMPPKMNYWKVHDLLKEKGITIYSPDVVLQSRQFQVATMGSLAEGDIDRFLNELRVIKDQCDF